MSIQHAGSMEELTQLTTEGIVLVDYSAPWCPPCKVLLPQLEALSEEMQDVLRVAYVNCDDLPEAASAAGVMGMPTVVLYKNGMPMDKFVGLRPKAVYQAAVEKLLTEV